MTDNLDPQAAETEESAPLFRNWVWWYALVLANLLLLIGLFYWFTKVFE
jgi:hypothetical protein